MCFCTEVGLFQRNIDASTSGNHQNLGILKSTSFFKLFYMYKYIYVQIFFLVVVPILIDSTKAFSQLPLSEALSSDYSSLEVVQIEGHLVLAEGVYRMVLLYGGWADAPLGISARSQWIEQLLENFLNRSGYELASVKVSYQDNKYRVLINEGRLDKIVFRNIGTWETIQLILLLDLPGKVFNREVLHDRLAVIKKQLGLKQVRYEIVPVVAETQQGSRIQDISTIKRLQLIKAGEPHELHIFIQRGRARLGLDFGLGIRPPDGLTLNAGYRANNIFFDEDRSKFSGRIGFRIRDIGRTSENPVGLSKASLFWDWSKPAIGQTTRLSSRIGGQVQARRRGGDINIDSYYYMPIRLGGGVLFEFGVPTLELHLGLEQRNLFAVTTSSDEAEMVLAEAGGSHLRGFGSAELRLNFAAEQIRRDRSHVLLLQGVYLWPALGVQGDIYKLSLWYENTVPIEYDELRYHFNSVIRLGAVPFYEEAALGDGFLRSAFQGSIFTRNAGALEFAYRWSLYRDIVKVSLFNDVAVYQALDALRDGISTQAIYNIGAGFHVLVESAFQVSFYVGPGFNTDGTTDFGTALDITLAY